MFALNCLKVNNVANIFFFFPFLIKAASEIWGRSYKITVNSES
jgi:hypothetical protein